MFMAELTFLKCAGGGKNAIESSLDGTVYDLESGKVSLRYLALQR